ncbi:unnamed protein product, partial [Didymodactylos carnosus]
MKTQPSLLERQWVNQPWTKNYFGYNAKCTSTYRSVVTPTFWSGTDSVWSASQTSFELRSSSVSRADTPWSVQNQESGVEKRKNARLLTWISSAEIKGASLGVLIGLTVAGVVLGAVIPWYITQGTSGTTDTNSTSTLTTTTLPSATNT